MYKVLGTINLTFDSDQVAESCEVANEAFAYRDSCVLGC